MVHVVVGSVIMVIVVLWFVRQELARDPEIMKHRREMLHLRMTGADKENEGKSANGMSDFWLLRS